MGADSRGRFWIGGSSLDSSALIMASVSVALFSLLPSIGIWTRSLGFLMPLVGLRTGDVAPAALAGNMDVDTAGTEAGAAADVSSVGWLSDCNGSDFTSDKFPSKDSDFSSGTLPKRGSVFVIER